MLNWRDARHPDAGGAELHLQEIGTRWVREGHEVHLLCAGFPNGKPEEVVAGIRVHRVGTRFTVYPRIMDYLRRSRSLAAFDVIFESINTVPFFSPLISSLPVVAQIYSIDNRLVLLKEVPLRKLGQMAGAYVASSAIPAVYRGCTVTTISKYSKKRLVEEGFREEFVHVAYPGVSEEFLSMVESAPEVERPNSTLVYLGRLKRYKGVDDLIRAMVLIRRRIPDARLLIIGKGDYKGYLRRLVEEIGLGDDVTFCGFVSEEEKAALLKSASLYVCTSKDEGGWTISGVEAMAAGVPLVVTDSQRDLIDDGSNGVLLPNSSPAVIAEASCALLENGEAWHARSSSAAKFSKRFNWDATAARTMDVIRAATGK